jgi:hypothetical protein
MLPGNGTWNVALDTLGHRIDGANERWCGSRSGGDCRKPRTIAESQGAKGITTDSHGFTHAIPVQQAFNATSSQRLSIDPAHDEV